VDDTVLYSMGEERLQISGILEMSESESNTSMAWFWLTTGS
jgi:hypothetical protein